MQAILMKPRPEQRAAVGDGGEGVARAGPDLEHLLGEFLGLVELAVDEVAQRVERVWPTRNHHLIALESGRHRHSKPLARIANANRRREISSVTTCPPNGCPSPERGNASRAPGSPRSRDPAVLRRRVWPCLGDRGNGVSGDVAVVEVNREPRG